MRNVIAFATIVVVLCAGGSDAAAATVFINEVDYDQAPAPNDTQEFVEIAGSAGANLAGYVLEFYDASNVVYHTHVLPSFTFPDFTNTGWGFFINGSPPLAPDLAFTTANYINDTPGGLKLLDPSFNTVQFISWGVTLPGATDVINFLDTGFGSISKTGPTSGPSTGTWVFAQPPTQDFLNGGQDLIPEPGAFSLLLIGAGALLARPTRRV